MLVRHIIAATLVSASLACWEDEPVPAGHDTRPPDDASNQDDTTPEVTGDAATLERDTTLAPDTAGKDAPTSVDDSPLGGDRPAQVILPPGYSPGTPRPLLVLLHGFSATGPIQDLYLGLTPEASAKGFITIVPDGTINELGLHFWNASPSWCCDFSGTDVDDSAYLLALVDEASLRFSIDPDRVYLVGHSNGGFMSHKMACEHADRFAAIAAIAGSLPLDEADCAPSEPVSVLQIHGTLDALVLYPGTVGLYPGVEEIMRRWAGHDGCQALPRTVTERDFDAAALGDETLVQEYPGCESGAVVLWKMRGSSHVPLFRPAFMPAMLDWLLAQRR